MVLLLLDPGERVDLMGLVDRAELGPVDLVRRSRWTGWTGRSYMAPVVLGDLASRVVLVAMNLAAPVNLVQTGLADRVGLWWTGRAWRPRRARTSRTGRPRWTATAAVRPTRFLRSGWPAVGRPQGRAARIQRAGSRCAASAAATRLRVERWTSPWRSAA